MVYNNLYSRFNKSKANNFTSYANRGMGLENDINLANEYYRIKDIAYIYKKPTPIKLVNVDYQRATIKEAYFETPSTTDYNGIYKGRYVDFEAKETTSKTSFSLANIHEHQIKHLINVMRHGAISFIIVRFNTLDETYLLTTEKLEHFIKNYERKSIPLSFFKNYGTMIKIKYSPRIDYLETVDKLYFGGNNYDEKKN
ncbi:MAG: Holliday junction resolvase RecU [Bacilli bacterium]|nr:Holliday junction resolvase RecU [Bacilli bacterium]